METLRDKRKELRAIQKAQDETNDLGQSIALSMQFEKAATEYLNIKYPKPKKSYEV